MAYDDTMAHVNMDMDEEDIACADYDCNLRLFFTPRPFFSTFLFTFRSFLSQNL